MSGSSCKGNVSGRFETHTRPPARYTRLTITDSLTCPELALIPSVDAQMTDYHAKYLAHELTRRCASDSVEKLTSVLADAQVDLNPHQVEAAIFAFRSPFSKGAILADEVGLGKTIEAGLLLSQKWAERKRRLLVILPANLRKQWSQEMGDKFNLPSVILERRSFNEAIRGGNLNPFQQTGIVLCSYQFARTMEHYIRQVPWDLVVIDEAHRLRNVYKKTNKTANALKQALAPFPKALLTATPLQNSLLELYGLVSFIDDFTFGDIQSFKSRFARLGNGDDFADLKERLKPICKRTLRRQVLEYVPYTDRHALVQEFVPSADEQRLYEWVSEYLQQPILHALPASQRQLITLVLRKLLASSTFAIAGTLEGMALRLESAAKAAEAPPGPSDLLEDYEELDETAEEWGEDEEEASRGHTPPTPETLAAMKVEAEKLRGFLSLATSILKNAKGEVLLTALRRGFAAASEARARSSSSSLQPKALIFTESRRTQEYLFRLLQETEFKGRIIRFNGTNADPESKGIYHRWLKKHEGTDKITGSPSADMRAALVECFRDEASILLATEAAAEGINLQFCNLVVNYDLPWNPQRIEQRIGRCHRYGQKCDVVVVNFLNKRNEADLRVYELLDQKFKLFHGVFGASDEVLGAIESGVDFEKRIAEIYQQCRSPEQIRFEFDQLQHDLESKIAEGQRDAREQLLDNFDQEVIEKVRVSTADALSRFNEQLWTLSRHMLANHAHFEPVGYAFTLHTNPFPGESIHHGPYRMGKSSEDANTYRIGHPLAQRILGLARSLPTPLRHVRFQYLGSGKKISVLDKLVGHGGWLACGRFSMNALEPEDHLILVGCTDDGTLLEEIQCRRFFDLPGKPAADIPIDKFPLSRMEEASLLAQKSLIADQANRNGGWFDQEMEKLDRWAEDRRASLKAELLELDECLKAAKKASRMAPTLPEKLERQREIRLLEGRRDEAWRMFDAASRDVDHQKDAVLDEISGRLTQSTEYEPLFIMRWTLM